MAIILQIETATQVCSAAIAKDGKTIALKELMGSNIHASSLTLFIQEVMDAVGLKFTDLDAIAVSKGPGSYTGLRIGVSTAKGLCYALDKPLIGVDTLQMMAAGYMSGNPDYNGLICPMIDARRMEVFTAMFNAELRYSAPTTATIVDEETYQEVLSANDVVFIGDGAAKCIEVISGNRAKFSDLNYNSAAHMSLLSAESFVNSKFEDLAYFEPFYLKDFVPTTPKKK